MSDQSEEMPVADNDEEDRSMTRVFFEDLVPEAMRDNRPLFEIMRGSICIAVQDEGAWTLRFGKYEEGCYVEELDEGANCVVVYEQASFEKTLMQEELTEEEAPKCYGDEKMLKAFGRLLNAENRGQLGIRTSKQ